MDTAGALGTLDVSINGRWAVGGAAGLVGGVAAAGAGGVRRGRTMVVLAVVGTGLGVSTDALGAAGVADWLTGLGRTGAGAEGTPGASAEPMGAEATGVGAAGRATETGEASRTGAGRASRSCGLLTASLLGAWT
ncbi:hypothetical protein [Deinococcus ruber]|uniref:Uncharacterized protein n=1 Tax=Deinococcus ruber TaxID=1848197 RepID=A0A918CNH8_9DEIO|nr:hypothetical protein [Deinococcus ruber]GGR30574.1 hypothetical protein GCM10008957_46640 [Deinococcus ruber]